jgi:hypothetical protein
MRQRSRKIPGMRVVTMQQQGIFSKQPVAKFEITNSQMTISHQGCPCSKRRRPERSEAERHKLIPENVRNLHKDLSPIVDERIPSPQQPIRRLSRSARKTRTCSLQGWIKVLQIAVVARVDCRAGIQQVGEQHITVKALAARESSQPGI